MSIGGGGVARSLARGGVFVYEIMETVTLALASSLRSSSQLDRDSFGKETPSRTPTLTCHRPSRAAMRKERGNDVSVSTLGTC